MSWFIYVLKKYAVFSGRASRREFWTFQLVAFLISIVLAILSTLVSAVTLLGLVFSLALIVPSIAVSVRRLHDYGYSGWLVLIAFIPLIGIVVLIFLWAQPGKPDTNKYGPVPLTEL